MKRLIIVSIISICMVFGFNMTPKVSKAATLPQVYFTGFGLVYVSVADLGTIFGNEWEIIVKNDYFFLDEQPWGVGFRFYNVTWEEAVQSILSDDFWWAEGATYEWDGFGTTTGYFSDNAPQQWTTTISSTLVPRTDTARGLLPGRGRR